MPQAIQLKIFDPPIRLSVERNKGEELKNIGMKKSEDSANEKHSGWSEDVFGLFKIFLQRSEPFMCEDFRKFCDEHKIETPPSLRAYASIITRAKKEGLIKWVGYGKVSNSKAHRATSSVWRKSDEDTNEKK